MTDAATTARTDRALGELLVERRLLSHAALEGHFIAASTQGVPLSRILIKSSSRHDAGVLAVVAAHLSVPFFDLAAGGVVPDEEALEALAPDVARSNRALPITIDPSGGLVVAVADPLDELARDSLVAETGRDVVLGLAPGEALDAAIKQAYAGHRPVGGDITEVTVPTLLAELMDRGGSDLHLTAGTFPQIRVDGNLVSLEHHTVLTPADVHDLLDPLMTSSHRLTLEQERELDFSHPIHGTGRFRVNVSYQRDSLGAVMRAIPDEIMSVEELGLPKVMASFAQARQGFVLVTGPTGAGKTTTLAALIDLVNTTRHDHIVTIEDPIEFMHRHKKSIVSQREIGSDTKSFTGALKHALRQDPDVILVGEMRDLETIAAAITAAETGHLVFATLHTRSASQSIERMIDVFPAHQQSQVRVQLAGSLNAIVSQQLVRRADGKGRVPAVEILVATGAIRNLIREGKDHQIQTAIQSGAQHGMQTMDASLAAHLRSGAITRDAAFESAHDPDVLTALL